MALDPSRIVAFLRCDYQRVPFGTGTRRFLVKHHRAFAEVEPFYSRCQPQVQRILRNSAISVAVLADVPVRMTEPGPNEHVPASAVPQPTGSEGKDPIEVKTSPSTLVLMRHGE